MVQSAKLAGDGAVPDAVQAIIDGLEQSILILDSDLRVIAASRSFVAAVRPRGDGVVGQSIGDLRNGPWSDAGLRARLGALLSRDDDRFACDIEFDGASGSRRTMAVNCARLTDAAGVSRLLLRNEDVTDRRLVDSGKDDLLRQKDFLLTEMSHRISNSLQILASILLLKARSVTSEETRFQLEDAHRRVMAVATVQSHLQPHSIIGELSARSYLPSLCESLSHSFVSEDRVISITANIDDATLTTQEAISLGLITTELIINALKHAFPNRKSGAIVVRYESGTQSWRLSVSDDGVGISQNLSGPPLRIGLGTSIVDALVRNLGGRLVTSNTSPGTTVSITAVRSSGVRDDRQPAPSTGFAPAGRVIQD
jgi:chemotaxis protein methyltransferase CheR